MIPRLKQWHLLASTLLIAPLLAAPAAMNSPGGRLALDIAGIGPIYLKSFQGGNAVQAPIAKGTRSDKYPDKQPGVVRYEDATAEFNIPGPRGLWDWLNVYSSPASPATKQLTFIEADYDFKEKSRRVFDDAALTLVELPACDASAKDAGILKLGFAPGRAKDGSVAAGTKLSAEANPNSKVWSISNFHLTIAGLPTDRVARIDAITIKRPTRGLPEYSNIVVSISDVDSAPFRQWASQSVEGKPSEKNGKLDYLQANLKDKVMSLDLEGLGVVRVFSDRLDANTDRSRRTKVELYVEKITFTVGSG